MLRVTSPILSSFIYSPKSIIFSSLQNSINLRPHYTTTHPSGSHVTVDMEFAVTKSSSASTLSYIYLMCVIIYNLFIHSKSYKHRAPSTNLIRMMIVFYTCATTTRKHLANLVVKFVNTCIFELCILICIWNSFQ